MVYPLPSRSVTSCRYNCLLDFLSVAACIASLDLNGMVSSVIDNVESSLNTRLALADDVVISGGDVQGWESEDLKFGILAFKAEKSMV